MTNDNSTFITRPTCRNDIRSWSFSIMFPCQPILHVHNAYVCIYVSACVYRYIYIYLFIYLKHMYIYIINIVIIVINITITIITIIGIIILLVSYIYIVLFICPIKDI